MAAQTETKQTLDIRPGVSVLSVLRHLNYKPWYALAEFVDNSVQSYLRHREELEGLEGAGFKLKVSIEIEPFTGGSITVRDNAAGIHQSDYARAFRPAALPPDRSGLSEFGMGMKSAACWFANNWSVRTSALGEMAERTVTFDVERIVKDTLEELSVASRVASVNDHFTELKLWNLHAVPQSRTLSKIKEHLTSMYRVYVRQGLLELRLNDELLQYKEPEVLVAPYFKSPDEPPELWRKEISFDFGEGQKAWGFAALRKVGSTTHAGFALFRRDRLIEGSGDETYRPALVFGGQNSYAHQRLFGELHLEGFEVSHTKDGFRWDSLEEPFLELLKEELDKAPISLLRQAEGYRARQRPEDWRKGAEVTAQRTAEVIRTEVPPVLEAQTVRPVDTAPPPPRLPTVASTTFREIEVELGGKPWLIALELSHEASVGDWLTVGDSRPINEGVRRVAVRVSLVHPFMERFATAEPGGLEPLVRVAAAMGLAEVAARDAGARGAGQVRVNVNELLRDAFSKP